jgi:hypothetical protein
MQARRKDLKANWDPVEFNRALVDSLMMYDLFKASFLTSDQPITNNASVVTEAVQASRKKNNVIQREIKFQRVSKKTFLGISKKIEEITNVQLVEQAHSHTMIRVDDSKRRECWGCQIKNRFIRPKKKAPPGGHPLQDITNKQGKKTNWAAKVKATCLQCNASLYVYGKCWDIYHRSKKFS